MEEMFKFPLCTYSDPVNYQLPSPADTICIFLKCTLEADTFYFVSRFGPALNEEKGSSPQPEVTFDNILSFKLTPASVKVNYSFTLFGTMLYLCVPVR